MTTLILISMCIFLLYTVGICITLKGIPQSISDTFYKLEEKHKGLGSLFTFFCWGVGFTVIAPLLEHVDSCPQFIRFFAVGGLLLVGAAPYFKGFDRIAHFVGAYMCIICSQIWAFMSCWWISSICWAVFAIGTAIYMATHKTGIPERTFIEAKPMFWTEVTAFVSVYTILLT